jgi:hypothetical protein
MKHSEYIHATYVYSHCNICDIQIYFCNIHIEHTGTACTYSWNTCNMKNRWKIWNIHLQHMCIANATYVQPPQHTQHSNKTLAIYVCSRWNNLNRLATYVYSHCNICKHPDLHFCNIHMEHLQYTSGISETLDTYVYNVRFSTTWTSTRDELVRGGGSARRS